MTTVTSTEFQKNFGTWKKKALRAPVTIEIHGKPSLVVLSAEKFRKLSAQAGSKPEPTQAEPTQPEAMESVEAAEALTAEDIDSLRLLAETTTASDTV
ncbi:type II toxin-antitoxin system Phd/YefM family antitoxin [Cereibacter sphaeroides]|uniref:type II toxin-antitoxin system Phd/YefM family antitoxin n=1 Tax=Cereibacter sphaeroides TaxID=1063 RepID=UPI001F2498AE|nr:type II toxin-antitoxin system Phd/YefM family antitoxin [Cereibacter sphaeroides]MCE6959574.1 type II toxin-antitoxin system Phd/YefM family antitoxin [Cereibacter sphaeroides]MCE6974566.1 type II toxin-antitoxin system Phd/YefM family antitoxin [Cereibacter sphaeroides]